MNRFKALYLEDDPEMQLLVSKLLPGNLSVRMAKNIDEALDLLKNETFHLVLVDLYIGQESGFKLIEELKNREFTFIPSIIIISASQNEADEIKSHEANVIEFIHKPLRPNVFKSQITKYLSRFENGHTIKKLGPLLIDELKMQVKKVWDSQEENVLLTLKEYKLLLKLINNPEKTYTREELLTEVWNASSDMQSRTIDMHISSLRKKLGNFGDAILSIRGVGYSFNKDKMPELPN